MSHPSFCIKYKVLKPQPSISMLAKSFREVENCRYLLASTSERTVRKYREQSPSIDQLLPLAEWRYEAVPQVAHCYFLQLLRPVRQSKTMEYEIYLQHIQLGLAQMKKLIAQESFYMLIQSIRGYQHLFSKFKKVSVTPKNIGLNAQGRCIVWHNEELNAFIPPFDAITKQTDLIVAIIQVIKERSQPICQGMLSRLADEARRKRFSFGGFVQHLIGLIGSMKIIIPQDLKYLVNQQKIFRNVQTLKMKTETIEASKSKAFDSKTQKFRPLKTENRQDSFKVIQWMPEVIRYHRMSEANMMKGRRVGTSLESKKFITQKDITHKKESYLSTNMSSFIASSDRKWNVLRNKSKGTDEGDDSNHHNFSKSRQRTVISKCKSSEGRNHSNINIIYARPFDHLIFSEKDPIDSIEQERTSFGFGHNSQYSDRANSFRQKQNHMRNQTRKIYKSFVIDFGQPIISEKNKCIGEECEEQQSSPHKQTSNEDEVNRSKASFQQEVQAQEVIKANQWTKNLDSHTLWIESKLNTSITLGQQRSSYLQDIKLQKLEMLSRQMAISRLPDDSVQPLYSQTIIE